MPSLKFPAQNTSTGENVQVAVVRHPDECPRCHHKIEPRFYNALLIFASGTPRLQVSYQCASAACSQYFIANFARFGTGPKLDSTFGLNRTEPVVHIDRVFPTEVDSLSPSFVRIFNQASAAEAYGLADIAGPGYGKALEFLVKDYLIDLNPDDAAAIKSEFLGNVIKNRVTDANIRATAERAAWLRNDETHYERRWEGKDIEDLKMLIQLTVNWIHSDLLTKKILEDMAAPSK